MLNPRPPGTLAMARLFGRTRIGIGELAVLIAVLALIALGIRGGQHLLADARTTSVVQAIDAYRDALKAYRSKYGALPGDDRTVHDRWGPAMAQAPGPADGALQGAYNSTDPRDESRAVWAQLRAAKLVDGQADDSRSPANPFGGIYGFQSNVMGMSGPAVCTSNVPGSVARAVLDRMGSGERDAGDVRAIQLNGRAPSIAGTAQRGPVPAADDKLPYVVCAKL